MVIKLFSLSCQAAFWKNAKIENKGNKESFIATKTLIVIDAYSRSHARYRNTPSEVSS